MAPIKKLYEVLILGLVWIPIAVVTTLLVHNMDEIKGEDFTAYGLLALLMVGGFIATEYILEAARVDTSYSPD
jgi:hypothetical protein